MKLFFATLVLFLTNTSLFSQALDHSAKYVNWSHMDHASEQKPIAGIYDHKIVIKVGSCSGLYEKAEYTLRVIIDEKGIRKDLFKIYADTNNKNTFNPSFYSILKEGNLDITVIWSYSKDSGETKETPIIEWADGDKALVTGTKDEKIYHTDGGKATLIVSPDGKLTIKDPGEDNCTKYSGVAAI